MSSCSAATHGHHNSMYHQQSCIRLTHQQQRICEYATHIALEPDSYLESATACSSCAIVSLYGTFQALKGTGSLLLRGWSMGGAFKRTCQVHSLLLVWHAVQVAAATGTVQLVPQCNCAFTPRFQQPAVTSWKTKQSLPSDHCPNLAGKRPCFIL